MVIPLKLSMAFTIRGCAPGWSRTSDQEIRRLLLYPLSYGRSVAALRMRRGAQVRTRKGGLTPPPSVFARVGAGNHS